MISSENPGLFFANHRLACVLVLVYATAPVHAQVTSGASTAVPSDSTHLGQVPRVPGVSTVLQGFNMGVTFYGAHDSVIGWYNVLTPALSYTFSRHYSADVSASVYPYRQVQVPQTGSPNTVRLVPVLAETGDTMIGVHAAFEKGLLRSTTSAYVSAPSGNTAEGLGTGKVAFDFSERVERYFGRVALLADIGAGNSSVLVNNLVTRSYSSVGGLTHFQEGVAFWLPANSYTQLVGYELVPFGTQTVYTDVNEGGAPPPPAATASSLSKDEGITASWGVPLTPNFEFSGYFSRSVPQSDSTVSFGFTYLLRGTLRSKKLSMIDRALREAETGSSQ